jgi:hypothetical protein
MNLSLPSKLFDEIAFEQAHFSKAPHAFFCAWQRGAELAGADYFGKGTEQALKVAIDKWELRPRMHHIERSFEFMTADQQMLIAVMASFYNSRDASWMLRRAGFEGFSDLNVLSLEMRKVAAALTLNYCGF